MKTLTAFFFLVLLVLGFALSAGAATTPRITATIVFTNQPTTGNTLSINSVVQVWTNNTPATVLFDRIQAQQTNSAGYLYTNTLNNNLLGSQFIVTYDGSNTITIVGPLGGALAVASTGTWETNGLVTNLYQSLTTVVTPVGGLASIPQTNIPTSLVGDLNTYAQSNFQTGTILMADFEDLSTSQTNTGAKMLTNANNQYIGGSASNVTVLGLATNAGSTVITSNLTVLGTNFSPTLNINNGTVTNNLNVSNLFSAAGVNDTGDLSVYGDSFFYAGDGGAQLQGYSDAAGLNNTWNIFPNGAASFTSLNVTNPSVIKQITIVNGGTFGGTNLWSGDISYTQTNITSLANGANQDLNTGTSVFAVLTGPTGAFSLAGAVGGRTGNWKIIENASGQTFTINNNSGLETTPANRILTGTGGDIVAGGSPGVFGMIYDSAQSRWVVSFINGTNNLTTITGGSFTNALFYNPSFIGSITNTGLAKVTTGFYTTVGTPVTNTSGLAQDISVCFDFTSGLGTGWGTKIFLTNYDGTVEFDNIGMAGLAGLTLSGSNVWHGVWHSNSVFNLTQTAGTIAIENSTLTTRP
jgi:hypothetical protein